MYIGHAFTNKKCPRTWYRSIDVELGNCPLLSHNYVTILNEKQVTSELIGSLCKDNGEVELFQTLSRLFHLVSVRQMLAIYS